MYCKMCGNLLGDTDRYCNRCGEPTGYKASEKAAETIGTTEEVVFNPPFEEEVRVNNRFPLNEEEPEEEPEKQKEDLKEFILDNEIEAHKVQGKNPGDTASEKNSEFAWNVHDFQTTRKTEDVIFSWKLEDFGPPELKDVKEAGFEEELFQEIRDESNRVKESNIDRFFTFSKKNEEFQELLDKEYEKVNKFNESAAKHFTLPEKEIVSNPVAGNRWEKEETPVTEEAIPEQDVTDIQDVVIPAQEAETATHEKVVKEAGVPEAVPLEVTPSETIKAGHLEEMSQARALFFGGELIKDNETIKKKFDSAAIQAVQNDEPAQEQSCQPVENAEAVEEPDVEKEPETAIEIKTVDAHSTAEDADISNEQDKDADKHLELPISFGTDEDGDDEKGRKKHRIGQILLVIIAIILIAEIAILSIRYFAPESAAAESVGKTQTQIINTVSGWMDGIKGLFSGNNPDEEEIPKGTDMEEDTSNNVSEDVEAIPPSPDPTPMADKDELVASQVGNNINIEKIIANVSLAYQVGKDYGLADINNSKPIENNIWLTPEEGEPIYYDRSIIGTVIAFDSQWIDYVNGGSSSVLDLLKKDSKAYQNAAGFSKIGKVKETFKLLEIGEIRQGANGFYVWVHEELQITENAKTANKNYNWIYYLEPVEGQMKIVNYF